MSEPSFGTWLRRERERRGATLKTISDQTKVSVPLLQGLEADDLSRWPTGIFRRAFVRSYATAIGLEPEDVIGRFEREHGDPQMPPPGDGTEESAASDVSAKVPGDASQRGARPPRSVTSQRARILGTAADLTVVLVVGLGSAAADSRLLWPVLSIAAYYALGVLLTGTSPMVALLSDEAQIEAVDRRKPGPAQPRTGVERRISSRRGARLTRSPRALRHQQRT
jgi:hypothetical protein